MNKKIECEFCNEEFEVELKDVLTSANYDVKKIINGEVFLYECPHCHKMVKVDHALSYIDNDKRTLLIYNTIPALYFIKEKAKKDLFGFKIKGASSLYDLKTKLVALVNNLNVKALKINEVFLAEYAKDKKASKLCLGYDENDNLAYHFYDELDNYLFSIPFTKDAYDKILNDYKNYLDYVDDYIFDNPKRFIEAVKNNYNWNKKPKYYAVVEINEALYLGKLMCPKKAIGDANVVNVKTDNEIVEGNIYTITRINDIDLPNTKILKVYPKE